MPTSPIIRLLAIAVAIPVLLVLGTCATVHVQHNWEASKLLRAISKAPLPKDAAIVVDGSDVGGFISGTGDAIDVLAYRVFRSDLPEPDVRAILHEYLREDNKNGFDAGLFRLDKPAVPRAGVTEQILRRTLPLAELPTYVFYSVDRIDDGTWDWRGW